MWAGFSLKTFKCDIWIIDFASIRNRGLEIESGIMELGLLSIITASFVEFHDPISS
jgi:hypothetical protein